MTGNFGLGYFDEVEGRVEPGPNPFGAKVLPMMATPLRGSAHTLKYSLYYGKDNKRLVGYDNERGKGDHRHIEGGQERYVFTSVEQLIADFLADVRGMRGEL
jgi:Family of unknown function (DUF6516)